MDLYGVTPIGRRRRIVGDIMGRSTVFALAGWMLTAAAAQAAEPVVVEPDWVRQPTEDEIFWAYPPAAVRAGIAGKAAIKCVVDEAGDPQLCVVVAEEPPGQGFGAAAVSLRRHMKLRPKTVDGKYAPGEVTIPINFVPDDQLVATTAPAMLSPRQEALARRIVLAMGLDADMAKMLDEGLQQSLYHSMDLDAEERRVVSESVRQALDPHRPKLAEALASDLGSGFDEVELERIATFFETAEGKKIARRLQESDLPARPALQALIAAAAQDANNRICRRSEAVCRKLSLRPDLSTKRKY